jgi:FAD/FMN-containing dehydrogenase
MKWFDRWAKLRAALPRGRVHTEQRELVTFLTGKISRDDLPAVIVEPAGEYELAETLSFAAEKGMRVAVSCGLRPLPVKNLAGAMLVLTTRIAEPPLFAADKHSVQIDAGLSAEALAIDLARAGRRWLPLWPVPSGRSVGSLIAAGWEGWRVWACGGLLAHVRSVDWMGFDGWRYSTGPAASGAQAPDVLPLLYGSRGSCGVITSLELRLAELNVHRTTALFEFSSAPEAMTFIAELRDFSFPPETVIFWGEMATELIRRGNDGTVADATVVSVLVEWGAEFEWPLSWQSLATPRTGAAAAGELWQNVFRMPRTAARIYPQRAEARMRAPLSALSELERIARELGRDANLPLAVWGTVGSGYMHVWALAPDEEARTQRRAEEAVGRLLVLARDVGCDAVDEIGDPVLRGAEQGTEAALTRETRKLLHTRCDPKGVAAAV